MWHVALFDSVAACSVAFLSELTVLRVALLSGLTVLHVALTFRIDGTSCGAYFQD